MPTARPAIVYLVGFSNKWGLIMGSARRVLEIAGGILAALAILVLFYWLTTLDWRSRAEVSADQQERIQEIQLLTNRVIQASELAELDFDSQNREREKQQAAIVKKHHGNTDSAEYNNELTRLFQTHTLAHKMRSAEPLERVSLTAEYHEVINELIDEYEQKYGALVPATD